MRFLPGLRVHFGFSLNHRLFIAPTLHQVEQEFNGGFNMFSTAAMIRRFQCGLATITRNQLIKFQFGHKDSSDNINAGTSN